MKSQKSKAGRKGKSVRSDCWVELELNESKGIELELTSKVETMYGNSIRNEILRELNYFGMSDIKVSVIDAGALPFVIRARVETAVKRLRPDIKIESVPEMRDWSKYKTEPHRYRRSQLYLPGNEPRYFINAGLHQPDGIIMDLEDSVDPAEKDAARILVRNALCQVNFYSTERMVRINQIPAGLEDLPYIVPYNVHVILIPKCESSAQVIQVDQRIKDICKEARREEPVYLMPIIESGLGIENSFEIAEASTNIIALTIRLEDYTSDIGTHRTLNGKESFWAKSQVVNAAKAAGIQAIDTVSPDFNDMDGLRTSVTEAKSLGFEGKVCIHPGQISTINHAFTPNMSYSKR